METMFIRPKSLTQDLTPQAIARITAKARVNNSRFVAELLPGPGEEVAIQAWEVL
jgi:hypothetical protein